jgi:predicted transcriptional regulator
MTKPTSIKLDPELKARVERLAQLQGRSTHGLLRDAVAEYVAAEESQAELDRLTVERWKAFLQTGEHVPAEDADAWLDQLAAGTRTPVPPARCG